MSASMGTGLQQLTPDTYRLSRVDGGGRYADAAAMKAAIVDEANAFAQAQGKVALPISSHEETLRGHLLTAEVEFRLATPGEAAAIPATPLTPAAPATGVGPAMRPVADAASAAPAAAILPAPPAVAVQAAAPVAPPAPAELKPDLYHELIMLDDLRKRGILTDAEFQTLKTKLIAGR
jgi:hypothetical protein